MCIRIIIHLKRARALLREPKAFLIYHDKEAPITQNIIKDETKTSNKTCGTFELVILFKRFLISKSLYLSILYYSEIMILSIVYELSKAITTVASFSLS